MHGCELAPERGGAPLGVVVFRAGLELLFDELVDGELRRKRVRLGVRVKKMKSKF